MRVRRDISSVPVQTATDTWKKITELITGKDTKDALQLTAATGVMGSIITDEHPSRRAIIVQGVGPQLRIYCRYGMKAVDEGGAVDPLTWNPTAGDWTMHVPCDKQDLDWIKQSLADTSPRIKAFDVEEEERDEENTAAKGEPLLTIDWNIKE